MAIEVNQLQDQAKLIRELRAKKTELSVPIKQVNESLDAAEASMIAMLNESGLKTIQTEFGRATVVLKSSVKIPETSEAMIECLEYIKTNDPDIYAAKVCMKSTDLNKYYEYKLEQAQALGSTDLNIPGLGGESFREILSFTKA